MELVSLAAVVQGEYPTSKGRSWPGTAETPVMKSDVMNVLITADLLKEE